MKNPRPLRLTELVAQLTLLLAAHGERHVWLDMDTSGWLKAAALDDDGDVTLYGNSPVDS